MSGGCQTGISLEVILYASHGIPLGNFGKLNLLPSSFPLFMERNLKSLSHQLPLTWGH